MSRKLMVLCIRGNIVYKSTKLAGMFSALPSFSAVAFNFLPQKPGADLNFDLQSLAIQGDQKTRSTANHSPRDAFRLFSSLKSITYKLFFIACIQGLLGLQQAYAGTYYVSPSGSDTNGGTSLTAPVRTINNALRKASLSGDIVYVRTGTYVETVSIQQSGITLSAYPGDKPVIDGQTTLPGDWGSLIFVAGNYNTVSGFEVKNSNINGVRLGGYSVVVTGHHNTISKINAHHAWESGVRIQGDYNIVEDSLVWQSVLSNSHNNGSVAGGWGAGLSAARNYSASALIPGITSYPILRRNKVFNNWGEGVICFEADHCTLEDNIVYDNWTVNLYLSDATNSLVQRNIVYVSSAPAIPTRSGSHPGFFLSDEKASVPRSKNNTIINNSVYNANFEAFTWSGVANAGLNNVLIANNTIVEGSLYVGSGGSSAIVNTNSQIRNNIILGTNSSVPSKTGITFSNNNWARTPSVAATVTDIVGDPQIARTGATTPGSLTASYFKILESSPVIDAATPLSNVAEDFFRSIRGTVPDIGGHEFSSNTVDSIAPSAPSGFSATTNSSTKITLVWSASSDNVGVTGYRIYRNSIEIGTSAVTSFTDNSVTGGATYSYTIKAYDAAGNLSASSSTATVTTPLAATVKITSYSAGSVTSTGAKINWTTDIPSTGVVSYGTSTNNLGSKVSASTSATSNSVAITGLSSNTKYYYQISVNSGSATALSTISSFITPLSVSGTCTQIALNVSGAWSDGGYSWMLSYKFGMPADNNNFSKQSTLRLFENGLEIRPAHSLHADIRTMGAGRFSHWSQTNGTGESIRFSASDNTNPQTNGKKYSYCVK